MNSELGKHDDGMIGLGVLALLTIALIAGQFHDSIEASTGLSSTVRSPLFGEALRDSATDFDGAIRELRVVPSLLEDSVDFGWASDQELINGYREAGF